MTPLKRGISTIAHPLKTAARHLLTKCRSRFARYSNPHAELEEHCIVCKYYSGRGGKLVHVSCNRKLILCIRVYQKQK